MTRDFLSPFGRSVATDAMPSSCEKKFSTALSQEAEVGVK
jgi:hypothetical protein